MSMLRRRDMLGSVLALPGRPLRWVFMSTPDDPGAAASSAPMAGARLRMTAPDTVVLPPNVTPHGPVGWITPPDVSSPRLPRLRAVLPAAWQTVAA